MRTLITTILLACLTAAVPAATPPDRINYEGVLRDSADSPIDATYDVIFRIFDAENAGSEILVDQHLIAGTGGVTFENGLFNAAIGGGNVLDGSGPGLYDSLRNVFRDYSSLWLELDVEGETLSPRVPIYAAGHALNSQHAEQAGNATNATNANNASQADNAAALNGLPASNFIDTTAATQTKSGDLTVNGVLTLGDVLTSAVGGEILLGIDILRLEAGVDDTDRIWLVAGNDNTDGRIEVNGDAAINLWSGGSNINFGRADTSEILMRMNPAGNLQMDGDLTVDGEYIFHGLARMRAGASGGLTLQAGDSIADDIFLQAGSGSSDGRIAIQGGSTMLFDSGNGVFSFRNNVGTELAGLNASGDLQIDGNLTVDGGTTTHSGNLDVGGNLNLSGNSLNFSAGASMNVNGFNTVLIAGDEPTDDLYIQAGDSSDHGRIAIFGDQNMRFESGNGDFDFYNSSNVQTAILNDAGDLQIDGDMTVSGGLVDLGGGATLSTNTFVTALQGGADASDDLRLQATSNLNEGSIFISGQGNFVLRSGNGLYYFYNGSALNTAILDSSGNLDLDGKLDLDGGEIYMAEGGVDQTQDLHFREDNLPSGERFQWDDPADRFEVSDDFHVFGTLTATTKNFVQNHPYRDDLEVVYTSLEGDEATAFTRGFGRMENGEARVTLGETFAYVVNPDLGLAAHLTPRGAWADLYVAELTPTELVVRAAPGSPDVAFDFMVLGLRIGHEDFPVLRPKRAEMFLPPDGQYDQDRAFDAELGEAAALSRYLRMAQKAGLGEIDFAQARALKAAIGQRPTQFDYPVGSELSVAQILLEERGADGDDFLVPVNEPVTDVGAGAVPSQSGAADAGTQTATTAPVATGNGDIYADSFRPKASEVATMLPAGETLSGGDVVAIDPVSGRMVLAREVADSTVFGVVAAEPGVILGSRQPEGDAEGSDDVPVAMSGIVLCKVDASYGAIRPGDLLTTSETAGHAMRAETAVAGAILGKALEPMDVGTGLIRVLVTLR